MPRARVLLYAALCLCVPLPAFALSAGSQPQAPADLSVSATFDSCALAETQIVCRIDVTYDTVEGATRYTASVARPDGSVVDHGAVDPGAATVWVPYAGNGTYLVEVSAYGEPEAPSDKRELLGRDEAEAEAEGKGEGKSKAGKRGASAGGAKGKGSAGGEAPTAACSQSDAEANAEDREELASLEQRAEALSEQAAEAKNESEARALGDEIEALEHRIAALADDIEAREPTACPTED